MTQQLQQQRQQGPFIYSIMDDEPTPITMGVYGYTKSGKTWFAAGCPKPYFLSVGPERGWGGLRSHPNAANIRFVQIPDPRVIDASGKIVPALTQMQMQLEYIRYHHEELGIRTVVVDTTSTYGELIVQEMTEYGEHSMWAKGEDNKWQAVYAHMMMVKDSLQGLPLHVVWTFHVDEDKTGDLILKRKPKLVGRKALKELLPTLGLLAYIERVDVQQYDESGQPDGMRTVRKLWTKCPHDRTPPFEVGCRWEEQLNEGCYIPDWAVLAKRLEGVVKTD